MRLSIHRVLRRLGRRFGRENLLPARSATTDAFGLIPALYTEHPEFRVEEPLLRRRAIEGTQSVLAAQAPGPQSALIQGSGAHFSTTASQLPGEFMSSPSSFRNRMGASMSPSVSAYRW